MHTIPLNISSFSTSPFASTLPRKRELERVEREMNGFLGFTQWSRKNWENVSSKLDLVGGLVDMVISWDLPGNHMAYVGFLYLAGWWFGCHQFYVPIHIGNLIIPIDEQKYFSEGWVYNHQPGHQHRSSGPSCYKKLGGELPTFIV